MSPGPRVMDTPAIPLEIGSCVTLASFEVLVPTTRPRDRSRANLNVGSVLLVNSGSGTLFMKLGSPASARPRVARPAVIPAANAAAPVRKSRRCKSDMASSSSWGKINDLNTCDAECTNCATTSPCVIPLPSEPQRQARFEDIAWRSGSDREILHGYSLSSRHRRGTEGFPSGQQLACHAQHAGAGRRTADCGENGRGVVWAEIPRRIAAIWHGACVDCSENNRSVPWRFREQRRSGKGELRDSSLKPAL